MGRAAGLGIFRALARGRYVALLLDQNANEDEGLYAPFFGVQACTRSGPARLAMRAVHRWFLSSSFAWGEAVDTRRASCRPSNWNPKARLPSRRSRSTSRA